MTPEKANTCHADTLLIYPWSRVLLEKLTVTQLIKKFPAFYGTLRLMAVFITARNWSTS
jgi:hypothetical protein